MNTPTRILIVTGDPTQFASTADLIRNKGHRITFADTSDQALRMAKAGPLVLVISELAMPDIDGPNLCRQIRCDHRLPSIPIILVGDLSRYSMIVSDALMPGAITYLQKPFTPRQLQLLAHIATEPVILNSRSAMFDLGIRPRVAVDIF